MKQLIGLTILILAGLIVQAQNERKFIREGNKIYLQALKDTTKLDTIAFSKAETEYRKALKKKPYDPKWNFNLDNTLYKQTKFDEAASNYEQLANQFTNPVEKARALHNLGNSRLMQQKLDESIESYKKALRQNPGDLETKYNLAYAQMLKKKQQDQQNKQDQNKDQNKDQDKQDQNKDQNKQDQNKQDQNKDQQKQNQNQQPQQNKISKENAEQLLQALQNDERNIQDKVQKAKALMAKKIRTEKDW